MSTQILLGPPPPPTSGSWSLDLHEGVPVLSMWAGDIQIQAQLRISDLGSLELFKRQAHDWALGLRKDLPERVTGGRMVGVEAHK